MNSITVSLSISNEEFSRLYRGEARDVICSANDGRTVQFPANTLRPYLTHNGIHGNFKIYFSEQHRFLKIEKS